VEKKTKIGTVRACLTEGCDWEKLAPEEKPAEKPAVAQTEEPAPVGVKG
jgi:hypothetical protein